MDLVTLGELLIDMIPAQVGKSLGEVPAFYPKPGGAPANVGVFAIRAPCPATTRMSVQYT